MSIYLKKTFKSNPVLYRAWFTVNRGKLDSTVRLPHKNDYYYFDGYPRSGNTYFRGLLKTAFPDFQGTSHLHTIAGLKIALSRNLKTLIIIRHPKDAILSNTYAKTHRKRKPLQEKVVKVIELEINEWVNYYKFVLKRQEDILPIVFENIVRNEEMFLNRLEIAFGEQVPYKKVIIENYKQMMRLKESSKEVAYSSLPNENRAKFKKRFLPEIELYTEYAKALELYTTISNFS